MTDSYDIKRKSVTMADGVPSTTWTIIDIRKIEVQPVRFSAERSASIVTINLGGQSFIPSFRGWCSIECDITATDRITNDSGTTDLLVLRTYEFEDHQEIDLREVSD